MPANGYPTARKPEQRDITVNGGYFPLQEVILTGMGNDLLEHLSHKYELQFLVVYTRLRTCCVDLCVSTRGKSMKIFVFLFPQFNFSAPKEEAYFKMLSEDELLACRMKDTNLRYSFFHTLFSK